MHQIETGLKSPDGRDCVFLWLYALDGKPYANYQEVDAADYVVPMVLTLLRWDGTFGTAGGKVDPGETLREALAREVKEELAYDLPAACEPVEFATFDNHGWHIHAHRLEVPYAELLRIRNQAVTAEHAEAECSGYNLVHVERYRPTGDRPRGIEAFLQNHFCATAKRELELLLNHIKAARAAG